MLSQHCTLDSGVHVVFILYIGSKGAGFKKILPPHQALQYLQQRCMAADGTMQHDTRLSRHEKAVAAARVATK